jgi:hypothetical protein
MNYGQITILVKIRLKRLFRTATSNNREIENKNPQTMNTIICLHNFVNCANVYNVTSIIIE